MIVYCDGSSFPDGPADLFYARVCCLWETYRSTGLAEFWIQRTKGRTAAWLCRLEQTLSVAVAESADKDELLDFISFLGAPSLFCPPGLKPRGYEMALEGEVLRCLKSFGGVPLCDMPVEVEGNPSGGRLYALLSQCQSNTLILPDRDGFLSDYARCIRLGTGRAKLLRFNGQDAAVAITTAETPGLSVLGGLAVLPQQREKGLATAVLARLTRELLGEGKQVFLATSGSDLVQFYTARDFSPCGGWRLYRRE